MRRLSDAEVARHTHVPEADRRRARVLVVPWMLPSADAVTFGRNVFVRRGREHDRTLLAHELVHVRQWREQGAPRFALAYVISYARGRLHGLRHRDAYRAIPAEVEARALAGG